MIWGYECRAAQWFTVDPDGENSCLLPLGEAVLIQVSRATTQVGNVIRLPGAGNRLGACAVPRHDQQAGDTHPAERGDVSRAPRNGAKLVIPAGVLGQVWRDSAQQVPLRALLTAETTSIPVLDQIMAQAAGVLCGRAGTSDAIDATVALTARMERAVVVMSNVEDIRQLDPSLAIERI